MTNQITSYNGKRIVDMGDEELLNTALFENVLVERTVGNIEAFRALRSAILLRMSQPKWVKVSERLPESEGRYLVLRSNEHPRMDIEWFTRIEDVWSRGFYDDGEQDTNVLAWMPLPKESL